MVDILETELIDWFFYSPMCKVPRKACVYQAETLEIAVPLKFLDNIPDSKVHGANMGPTWVLPAPDGPHGGPMNLIIRDLTMNGCRQKWWQCDQ